MSTSKSRPQATRQSNHGGHLYDDDDEPLTVVPQRTALPKVRSRSVAIDNDEDTMSSSSVKPSKKRKMSLRGQSYSDDELKSLLFFLWKGLPAPEVYKAFLSEYPTSGRTKNSFNQKYH